MNLNDTEKQRNERLKMDLKDREGNDNSMRSDYFKMQAALDKELENLD
jgi:hypothetical protein